ncbi:MAG: OmpA family protein [Rikenellaceae bacterium]
MKKLIFTTMALLMSAVGFSAFAQTVANDNGDVIVESNDICQNWFITGGIGTTVFAGESDKLGSFGSRFAPAFDIAVGKWFNPYIGARLQFAGPQLRGFTYLGDEAFGYGDANSEGLYKQKWNYIYLHADLLVNLSNLIGGYKEDRFYTIMPYAGAGWIRATESNMDALAGNLGLFNEFRLNSKFALNLDIKGTIIGEDNIDNETGGRYGVEGLVSTTVGVTYKIGKQGWKRPISENVIADYKKSIGALEADANKYKIQLAEANDKNVALQEQVATVMAENKNKEPEVVIPSSVILFEINKSNLSNIAKVNLDKLAVAIKKMPAGKKVSIVGYADKATGNAKFNTKLSQERAEAVSKYLVEECGVSSSKLSVSSKGGVDNMFYNEAPLSRAVIIE